MGKTSIEWTRTNLPDGTSVDGYSWNAWIGCSKVHTGCANCYAETFMAKRFAKVVWGPNGTRRVTSPNNWEQPLKWNARCKKDGIRRKVFLNPDSDFFEAWGGKAVHNHSGQIILESYSGDARDRYYGTIEEWNAEIDKQAWHSIELDAIRKDVFNLIDKTRWLDWIMLTKRPENVLRMWPSADVFDDKSPHKAWWPHIWLGTSVSDQTTANKMVPRLLKCRELAPVLFISAEPLLAELDLRNIWDCEANLLCNALTGEVFEADGEDAMRCIENNDPISWVIVGGESGAGARPYWPKWAGSIINHCADAGVPCFHKQMGSNPKEVKTSNDGERYEGRLVLKDKKGGDMSEWPEHLCVRQWPITSLEGQARK